MRSSLLFAAFAGTSAFKVAAPRASVARGQTITMQAPAPAMVDSKLETVTLKNAAGDTATVYKFGACVTSYVKGGTDMLMVRPDAKMDGSKPISGGIPHCFPQFGPGAIQQHGFARNLDWEIAEQSGESIVFRLTENEYTLAMWPYAFEAKYTVALKDDRLATELAVTNTGDQAFDFTAALHTYWSITGIDNIKISSPSFDGSSYLDKTVDPPTEKASSSSDITISSAVDSVYAGVSGDVQLVDSGRSRPLTISNVIGWSDTVVWSPYGDENMGFDKFVCVESAQASSPVVLQPKEYWTGAMDVVP